MSQITLPGNPPISVVLRRSARARRLSLRISSLDGRVTLTLPNSVSDREGQAFLRDKENWLRGHLAKRGAAVSVTIGAVLPLEGTPVTICAGSGRSVRLDGDRLYVPGPADRVGARLQGWLKTRARDRLADMSDYFSDKLGRPYARLTLRDTRSRWGSCTADGGLMYSWRLILAWPEVLDYVAAHEVAHLRHMNHSQAFWDEVTHLYGDWSSPRKWLRENGHELHRYRFDD
ncbi:MAG: M48 family metallopeptidase [Pelagimonas sp.]|jgi:predicted metal-dependent hydrolase|nr:M48 family metallopeptidase [Pelagimonas sp.]